MLIQCILIRKFITYQLIIWDEVTCEDYFLVFPRLVSMYHQVLKGIFVA